MTVAKLVGRAADEVRARIAARNAEISILEKNLADLKARRDADAADLAELETAVPEVKIEEEN